MGASLLFLLVLSPTSLLASPFLSFLNGNNGGTGAISSFLLNTGSNIFCTNAADNQGCLTCMTNGGLLNIFNPSPYTTNMANCIQKYFGSQYSSCADGLTSSSQGIFGGNALGVGKAISCVLVPKVGGSGTISTTTSTTTQATTTRAAP